MIVHQHFVTCHKATWCRRIWEQVNWWRQSKLLILIPSASWNIRWFLVTMESFCWKSSKELWSCATLWTEKRRIYTSWWFAWPTEFNIPKQLSPFRWVQCFIHTTVTGEILLDPKQLLAISIMKTLVKRFVCVHFSRSGFLFSLNKNKPFNMKLKPDTTFIIKNEGKRILWTVNLSGRNLISFSFNAQRVLTKNDLKVLSEMS